MTYPAFVKHTDTGIIVDTETKRIVAIEGCGEGSYKVGDLPRAGEWGYMLGKLSTYGWHKVPNPCDPSIWTDPFGLVHKLALDST